VRIAVVRSANNANHVELITVTTLKIQETRSQEPVDLI
jgi:hypothetical protein